MPNHVAAGTKKKKPRKPFGVRVVKTRDKPVERWERTDGDDVLGAGSGEWRKTDRDWVKWDLSRTENRKSHFNAGSKSPLSKLTDKQVVAICEMYGNGISTPKLASRFCVSRSTIYNIVNFISYRNVVRPSHLLGSRSIKSAAPSGSSNYASKLTDLQVETAVEMYRSGKSINAVAICFGMSRSTMAKAISGNSYRNGYRKQCTIRTSGEHARKFDNETILEIRRRYKAGDSQSAIGIDYATPSNTIRLIVNYKTYKDLP